MKDTVNLATFNTNDKDDTAGYFLAVKLGTTEVWLKLSYLSTEVMYWRICAVPNNKNYFSQAVKHICKYSRGFSP